MKSERTLYISCERSHGLCDKCSFTLISCLFSWPQTLAVSRRRVAHSMHSWRADRDKIWRTERASPSSFAACVHRITQSQTRSQRWQYLGTWVYVASQPFHDGKTPSSANRSTHSPRCLILRTIKPLVIGWPTPLCWSMRFTILRQLRRRLMKNNLFKLFDKVPQTAYTPSNLRFNSNL